MVDPQGFGAVNGNLGCKTKVNGGIAWVLSREVNGHTSVSEQQLEVNNNLLSAYTSATARENAIQSYGGVNKENYLTPYDDDDDEAIVVNP